MGDLFLYEQVRNYILDEIRSGRLRPGDRVPSEKELAERFSVSRITSKRALAMLEELGLVDRARGKGSFVARRLPPLHQLPGAPPDPLPAEALPAQLAERRATTEAIGLVLPDASQSYGLELLCAIEERAAELGYNLVLRRTRGKQDEEEYAIDALTSGDAVQGLIVFPVHGEFYNTSLVRLVLENYPLVLVDRFLRGIPARAVYTDNVAAAHTLTSYLLDRGHRNIAFCSPPVANTSSIEGRMQGYTSALVERGYGQDLVRCFTECRSPLPGETTGPQMAADRKALAAYVTGEPTVTAFVACEYNVAILLRQALREMGAPLDRYQIACFDSPNDGFTPPPFVHIKQDQRAMGHTAVDLLVAQLNGEIVPLQNIIPFTLVDDVVTDQTILTA